MTNYNLQIKQLTRAIKPTKDPVQQKQNEYRMKKLKELQAQQSQQAQQTQGTKPSINGTAQHSRYAQANPNIFGSSHVNPPSFQDTGTGANHYAGATSSPTTSNGAYDQTRAAPTVATAENPVVTVGGRTNQSETTPQNNVPDQQRLEEIFRKKYRGEPLSEDDAVFLYNQQIKQSQVQNNSSAVTDVYSKQIQDTQAQFEQRQQELQKQREQLLSESQGLAYGSADREKAALDKAAQSEIQAGQNILAFNGFGVSSDAVNSAQAIQQKYNEQKLAVDEATNLKLEAYQKELQGADEAELQTYKDRISQLEQDSAQYEVENAKEVAKLNQQNGVDPAAAMENILQTLSTNNQTKVDKDISELLGYVADEYGNPVVTDESGNPVYLSGEPTKYESYTDSYTGQTYFYDPADPIGTWQAAPGNTFTTYTNSSGETSTSPTTYTGGVQDITSILESDLSQYSGNCVLFARNFCPSIPTGATSINGRIEGIKQAQEGGYGGTNMDLVQVGDAIHTKEGDVGHTAIVTGIEGDNLVLLEANYKTGKVTYGRKISKYDPVVLGWIRSNGTETANNPLEGNNYGLDQQVSGSISFTPGDKAMFRAFAAKGTLPTFTGRSQAEKDQKQADFLKNYNYWAAQPENQAAISSAALDSTQQQALNKAQGMSTADSNYNSIKDKIENLSTTEFYTYSYLPNAALPDYFQQFKQAVTEFASLMNYGYSGANVTPAEYQRSLDSYFPAPGDSSAVIQQKNQAREGIIQSFYQQAGQTAPSSSSMSVQSTKTRDQWAQDLASTDPTKYTRDSVLKDFDTIDSLAKSKNYDFDLLQALNDGYTLQEIYDYLKSL